MKQHTMKDYAVAGVSLSLKEGIESLSPAEEKEEVKNIIAKSENVLEELGFIAPIV